MSNAVAELAPTSRSGEKRVSKFGDDRDRRLELAWGTYLPFKCTERSVYGVAMRSRDPKTGIVQKDIRELAAEIGVSPLTFKRNARRVITKSTEAFGAPLLVMTPYKRGEKLPSGFRATRACTLITAHYPPAHLWPRDKAEAKAWIEEKKILAIGLPTEAFSSWLPRRARRKRVLTSRRAVLYGLQHGTDHKTRESWPGYEGFSRLFGLSKRTVGTAARELRAMGFDKVRKVRPNGELPDRTRAEDWLLVHTTPRLKEPPPELVVVEPVVEPASTSVCADDNDARVGRLLEEFTKTCKVPELGPNAAEVLFARLEEGATDLDVRCAIAGVASTKWRMEIPYRREVRAVFSPPEKFAAFIVRGVEADSELAHLRILQADERQAREAEKRRKLRPPPPPSPPEPERPPQERAPPRKLDADTIVRIIGPRPQF